MDRGRAAADAALVRLLRRELDDGEAEAIALAVETSPVVTLLDEADARCIARVFQLPISGAVGVLMRAKLAGKESSLRRELDRLRYMGGFWLAGTVYDDALRAVGEE